MNDEKTQLVSANQFFLRNEADGTKTAIGATVSAGRDSKCDLVIPSPKASRVHARIWVDGAELWVQDQGSTNGTFVNDQKISEKTRLEADDTLRFANIHYRVITPEQEKPEAAEAPDAGATMLHVTGETDVSEQAPGSTIDPSKSGPSIPVSWADAEALEKASQTKLVSRAPGAGTPGRDSTDPLRAIAVARREAPPEDPILVGLTDPIGGRIFKLRRTKSVNIWEIGRGESADIRIDSESVSGRHAQLVWEHDRWKVVNLMSVNGTFVNDRKVLSAYLSSRDKIRVGDVELAFDGSVERRRKPRDAAASRERSQSGGLWAAVKRIFGK